MEDIVEGKLLIESISPCCPLYYGVFETEYATVLEMCSIDTSMKRKSGNPIFLYCWIRNHINYKDEDLGEIIRKSTNLGTPILPKDYINNPNGSPYLNPDNLQLVWFEEGNGVALIENEKILAIVPPGAIEENLPSYSLECKKESLKINDIDTCIDVCPLEIDNPLINMVKNAKEFWVDIYKEEVMDSFFEERIEILKKYFGEKYIISYNEDQNLQQGHWPVTLIIFEKDDETYVVTFGLSFLRQPFELSKYNDYKSAYNKFDIKRIEIGFAIKTKEFNKKKETILNFLINKSKSPWQNFFLVW